MTWPVVLATGLATGFDVNDRHYRRAAVFDEVTGSLRLVSRPSGLPRHDDQQMQE